MPLRRIPHIERLEERRLLAATSALYFDLNPGPASGISIFHDHALAVGDALYYSGSDGNSGFEPFRNVAQVSHLLMNIASGAQDSVPSNFTLLGSTVYFLADDTPSDTEIWATDDQNSVNQKTAFNGGGAIPSDLFASNDHLLFFTIETDTPALWRIADGGPQYIASVIGNSWFGDINGTAYFDGNGGTNESNGLWKTDGTTATLVRSFSSGSNLSTLFDADKTVFNGTLYFTASNPDGGAELWRSDGTADGTVQVSHINSSGNAEPQFLTVSGGKLYFVATTPDGTNQVFRTDGTAVTQISRFASAQQVSPQSLTDVNGTLFFVVQPNVGTGALYKLVGDTPTVIPASISGGGSPDNLLAINNTLFFRARNDLGALSLYQSDGTSIVPVAGVVGANPEGLIEVDGDLFYAGDSDAAGHELYQVTGIADDAQPVTVRLKASSTSPDEGDTVSFNAVATGPTALKYYFDFGDGAGLVRSGHKPTYVYADNLSDDAVRHMRVKVVDLNNGFDNATISIRVRNVAPTFKKVIVPTAFVPNIPMPFEFVIADPGKNDNDKVTVSWGEDIYSAENGVVRGTHVFKQSATLSTTVNLTITAADKDGGATSTHRSVVLNLAMHTDATIEGLGVHKGVLIAGTPGNDRYTLSKSGAELNCILNGVLKTITDLSPDDVISCNLGDGNDRLEVDPGVTNSVYAEGGNGNDTLGGGQGNDSLRGGAGNDRFLRSSGKDRLIS